VLLDRTTVHRWDSAGSTYLVALLADGESFVDSVNGITVTQTSHTGDRATVLVSFNTGCRPALPTVSLSPASQNANPGGALEYTVSVTNTDSTNCSQTLFDLRSSVPFGWGGSLSPTSLALLPGNTGQARLSVTSPAGTAEGNYSVGVDVWDTSQPSRLASGNGSYNVVLQTDLNPPTAPASLSAAVRRKGVSLSWSSSQDNVGVSGYRVFRDGLMIGATATPSYIDGSISSGATYQYFVKAFDAAANMSPSSNTATAMIGGGSGGGGGKGGPKP
jgi:NPCBM-associated, NEW3 domain of alpha-galactosidase